MATVARETVTTGEWIEAESRSIGEWGTCVRGTAQRARTPHHATRPWPEGGPYLTDTTIVAQRKAIPTRSVVRRAPFHHPMLVRDPEPEMVETLRNFVLSLAT